MIRAIAAGIAVAAIGAATTMQSSRDETTKAHPIQAREAGIGSALPKLTGKSITGSEVKTTDFAKAKALVVALASPTCPLGKKQIPTLQGIEKQYVDRGVRFVFVNPELVGHGSPSKSPFTSPYVADPEWAAELGAKTSTEVFVYDADKKLAYRGAIDDQYGIGYSLEKPKSRFLVNALESLLNGKRPSPAATWSPGCALENSVAEELAATYYETVAPIVQEKCLPCHREGGVGPFKLDSYEAVKSRAPMIKYVVDKGIMPPWFAKTEGKSPFKNDRSLNTDEKSRIYAWIDAGTPAGDPSAAPKPRTFDPGWETGKPDHIIRLPQPIKVKATGIMPYQEVVVSTGLAEDKWIGAMEVRPSARQVVHHVLVFVRERGAERQSNLGEEISGFFAAYVPGTSNVTYPKGYAKKLPAGASVKFQIHYTPNGEATEDQTELGLHFADNPIEHEVHTTGIANLGLNIPPGAEHHEETAMIPVPFDAKVMSLIPHLHVRGAAAKFDLLTPDGKSKTLLDVPRYDFNWQLNYEFRNLVDAPKGSRLKFTAWYDNSDKNPANPDPTKRVRWGSQTYDEMHLGYVEYIVPGLKPGDPLPGFGRRGSGALVMTIFRQLDKDADGFVTEAEAGLAWNRFKTADANGDGKLTLEEAMKLLGG